MELHLHELQHVQAELKVGEVLEAPNGVPVSKGAMEGVRRRETHGRCTGDAREIYGGSTGDLARCVLSDLGVGELCIEELERGDGLEWSPAVE